MPYNLEIKHEKFYVDGQETLLLCGEIHYFRMEVSSWEKALDKLVEAGCNAVAYYVPWFVHEYAEGCFDFSGSVHPSNNLVHWLELTQKKGLLGIFRPGPYVYAECVDLGIPQWFTKKYPNAQVKKYENGSYVDASAIHVVGHNHPDFLAATKKWYQAVCSQMKPYLAPQGNIVMVQLCNEIPADDYNDHNTENLEIGKENGRYARYLHEKYVTIENLEQKYGTKFPCFDGIEPYMLEQANDQEAKLERLEFYYNHYYPEYFQTLAGYMAENGIQSNFCHNAYNPRAISLHVENRRRNPWLHVGIDCYFSLNGSLNLKDLAYYCEYGAEYSRGFLGGTPFVLEQECGYWNDYPIVHGPELYVWNVWMIAAGYKGFNMYLFASGHNRPGMGFYGTSHNWQAPVDKAGNAQASFGDIQRSIVDIHRWQKLITADNRYDITLGIKNDPGLIWKPVAKSGDETYFALRSEGYTPQVVNILEGDSWINTPALVMVADERMDASQQEKLLHYVQKGGKLLLLGCVPYLAMDGTSCTIFAQGIGLQVQAKPNVPPNQQIITFAEREYYTGAIIQPVRALKNAQQLGLSRDGEAAVWHIAVGQGCVITAPFDINVVMQDTAALLRLLLQQMNVPPAITGALMLRAFIKQNGHAVIVNLHPVCITEKLEILGKEYMLEMHPYSVEIVELEG